ncbi:MAG: hypothetical protein VKM92_02905 [Cyanobacteriota bacterium]|nr:hypothetical protein [Cyanobacteriota bacterium]
MFNNKGGFFLDLGSEGAKPAQVAIAPEQPAPRDQEAAPQPVMAVGSKPAAAATQAPAPSGGSPLTTAEAIAAELRAAQAARPAATLATFAPECLNPANAVPSRRRRAGANLAGFKSMAAGLFRN